MSAAQTINEIIEKYILRCDQVLAAAKPGDGLFGLGDDPRRDPCHMLFYEELSAAVDTIVSEYTIADDIYSAVNLLLRACVERDCPEMARWMLAAAHKLALPLVKLLTTAQREAIREWYDATIPRRERLPVQNEVYKALK